MCVCPNNINCTNLRNRNGHAVSSLSTLSVCEKNFSVVSCCCWSQDKKILPGTGMTHHSLPSQASQVPGLAGQWEVPTDSERLTPGEDITTGNEQLAVVNIYSLLLQWWVGSKKVQEIGTRCLWIKPGLTYVIWSFYPTSIWSIKSHHLCLTATYL